MLQTLRNNTWIVELIVGAIAIMMIIFFGSETIRRGDGLNNGNNSPVKVNGTKINPLRVNFLMSQQLENYRQFFKNGVPEAFTTGIRQNVVSGLVNRELLWQEAQHLGLTATPDEIAAFVRAQPQFQENGEFQPELYKDPEGYRMAFQQRSGISYTSEITTQLTLDKLMDSLDGVITPSDDELRWLQTATATTFDFSVIRIDKTAPKTPAADAAVKPDTDPKTTADFIYNLWKSGGDVEKLLKDRNLEIRNTGPLVYGKLNSVFDGNDDREKIKVLAGLKTDKPFPGKYFETENFFYLVRLTKLKQADPKDLTEQKTQLTGQYKSQVSAKLQEALVRELRKNADIVMK